MNIAEFERLVHIGLGRAVLYLQQHDSTPFRDVILHACLHNTAYDPQSEGPRGEYLFDLIKSTEDEAFYCNRVLEALASGSSEDEWDELWLFDLARVFAQNGNAYAREVMYARFAENMIDQDATGAEAIIELDGLDGFCYVADKVGEVILSEPDLWGDTQYLFWLLEDRYGEAEALALLETARTHNPRIEAVVRARRPRLTVEDRSIRQVQSFLRLPYSEVRDRITQRRGGLSHARLARWGANASMETLEQAAADLSTERDPARLAHYLAIFAKRPFPYDPGPLVKLVFGQDDKLAWLASTALSQVNHPGIRDIGFRLLERAARQSEGIQILAARFQDDDRLAFEGVLHKDLDKEAIHSISFTIRDVYRTHPSTANVPALLLLYDRGPCSYCRADTIELLFALDAVPEWIRGECRYDCNTKIRKYGR